MTVGYPAVTLWPRRGSTGALGRAGNGPSRTLQARPEHGGGNGYSSRGQRECDHAGRRQRAHQVFVSATVVGILCSLTPSAGSASPDFAPPPVAGIVVIRGEVVTASTGADSMSWLDRVNTIRTGAGLPPVTENPAWTQGIRNHLTYLSRTPAVYLTGEYAERAHGEPGESLLHASRSSRGEPEQPHLRREQQRRGGHQRLAAGAVSRNRHSPPGPHSGRVCTRPSNRSGRARRDRRTPADAGH